ncbi:MAG: hypothetical protein ACI8W0_000671 [Flavobacterium sp.]|jgi:hypothetical protein
MKNRITRALMGLALFILLGGAKPTVVKNTITILPTKIETKISGTSTAGKYSCTNTFYKRRDTIILYTNKKIV